MPGSEMPNLLQRLNHPTNGIMFYSFKRETPITFAQIDVKVYDKLFNANLRAPVFLSKYALPHLKKSKGNSS